MPDWHDGDTLIVDGNGPTESQRPSLSVTSVVTLKRQAAELRLNGGDERWASLVGKLPGS